MIQFYNLNLEYQTNDLKERISFYIIKFYDFKFYTNKYTVTIFKI